ncbi:unnamed protein product [Protopolystoma xenopodis]|uniref:Fibronectin type-III domain-containing protein n=1 Tax=Protopolystoma xenopodis TaxID=117903 RepID=A0A3S5CRW1_9PLAT|nr:unnamed protein product [Protopolystoma xenopodis]
MIIHQSKRTIVHFENLPSGNGYQVFVRLFSGNRASPWSDGGYAMTAISPAKVYYEISTEMTSTLGKTN